MDGRILKSCACFVRGKVIGAACSNFEISDRAAADADSGDVLKTTVFLANMADFSKVPAICAKYVPSDPLVSSYVGVAAVPRG